MEKKDKFLKSRDVIEILNISRAELYKMINSGEIQCYRFGERKLRFLESDIAKFIAGCFKPAEQKIG